MKKRVLSIITAKYIIERRVIIPSRSDRSFAKNAFEVLGTGY